ncbi:unnamed protein product [Sphagnum troendelagicum]|uniref:At4g14310 8-bladed propeller domain-containing protein n=1 Tax=Sphagnum troendelagicum TaxID=128251 RepID=A0ABP0U9N0_9BRYO
MGPLRKKGRGAGGGKTEALAPGEELPGISPELDNNKVRSVTMNGRKESITKSSSSASAAFESLNAASRFGLSSEHDEKYYATKASSSLSSDFALAIRERHKKFPLSCDVSRDESLRKSLSGMLGRSACNCVSGRSSVATSPDRSHSKISPRETPSPQLAALKSAIFTKENADQATLQNVTKSPALEHTCNRERHCEAASSERFQNVFHGRLSRLEGKVSQIAAELRETKALLEENNRICSNALFVDLQTKVANMERALTSGLGDMISAPQPEGEGVRDHEVLGTKPISGSTESHRHSAASNGEIAGHMRAVFGGEDLKERSSLQQRLLNSRPSLHEKLIGNRADLYEKLKHNRELLCNKLATLGGRDRVSAGNCDEGAMVAAEFLLSLDEAQKLGGQAGDDSMVQSKTHVDLVKPSLSMSAVKNQYMDFALEQLRSSGSFETQNTASGARSQEPTFDEEPEESLHSIGDKTAVAGWFVKEGEGIAFAHDDGSCSYYDVPNMEEKARYSGPKNVSKGEWGDCWVIRASGSDGCSRQYFIAAAAGGARSAAAFCSWDLYDRTIAAYHCDSAPPTSSSPGFFTVDSPEHAGFSHPGLEPNRRSFLDTWAQNRNTSGVPAKASLWWYRPCGALVASAGTCLNTVSLYDIRDGECMMKWDTKNAVASMDFSSPVQWRTSSRLVVVEDEGLSLWDVEGMEGQRLHNVNLVGKQPRALHVHNMDAECSGGVRQRLSSSDQHNDGVLCTNEAVNVLDFRVPAGIAMKIPTFGEQVYSVFTNGDMVLAGTGNVKIKPQTDVLRGGTENVKPSVTTQCCKVNQWSIREGKPMNVYALPEGEGKPSHPAINQVWGDARSVMALNEHGLYIFNADKGMELQDVICADNSALQTFDYANSHLLLVSRDRPPLWRNWP